MLGFREELLDQFRREKREGVEALRRGDHPVARRRLLAAADALDDGAGGVSSGVRPRMNENPAAGHFSFIRCPIRGWLTSLAIS